MIQPEEIVDQGEDDQLQNEKEEEGGFKHLISEEEKEKLLNIANQNLTH